MNNNVVAVSPEIIGVVDNAEAIAKAYVIDSQDIAELAAEDLRGLARMKKQVEDARFAITRPLDAAKKAAMDAYRPMVDRIERADAILRGKVNTFMIEERRRREAEEAEIERIRKEKAAELEAEAYAAIEAGDEQKLDEVGEKMIENDLSTPALAKPEKLSGISQSTVWKVESIDLRELVRAAAKDDDLLVYLSANTVEINRIVKSLRSRHRIPGVVAKEEVNLSVRK